MPPRTGSRSSSSNRHYEAAKTIILTEHQRSLSLLFVNERKFNGLPADQQKALLDAGAEASVIQRKRDTELNAEAVERMKAKGTTFVVPDKARFLALIAPIQDEVGDDPEDDGRAHAGARPREVMPDRRAS